MESRYDCAVVGAGILGLAHAYHLAKTGMRVVVVERQPRALGASVRNFGMLWPIGQPPGAVYDLSRRSLEIWLEVLSAAHLWHDRCGSLHLAYHADEAAVLNEFLKDSGQRDCSWLSAQTVATRFPAVNSDKLQGGMFSPVEACVDPREVLAKLPIWLKESLGVDFVWDCQVFGYDRPLLRTSRSRLSADRMVVCSGDDFQTLFPEAFADLNLKKCKLQMLRTEPMPAHWRLGPMLAAGLTLRHYRSFSRCPTLPELCRRLDAESPEYARFGIHVMASQNGRGELTLGDSHEYGDAVDPFNKDSIDALIMDYLAKFLKGPLPRLAERWHGSYAKHPTLSHVVLAPTPGVTIVNGVGGAGMTLSFGLAEQVVREMPDLDR